MVQTAFKPLTLDKFLQLPETKPASEYIDGQIIQKPMPQGKHSTIRGELVSTINDIAESPRLALAFPELRCSFAGRSIVPDVVVLQWDRIPCDESGDIANIIPTHPDWIIEILSPDQSPTKIIGKILHCLQQGTLLGWLIDPAERSILVFPPNQQPDLLEEEENVLPVPNFVSELNLTVGNLFGWLKL